MRPRQLIALALCIITGARSARVPGGQHPGQPSGSYGTSTTPATSVVGTFAEPVEVSGQALDEMKSLIGYLQSTYCVDGLDTWSCSTCVGPTVGTSDVRLFGQADRVFGYAALHRTRNLTIVAFRGSRNFNNWINNIMMAKPDCPFPGAPTGTKVHYGFLQSWQYVRASVLEELAALIALAPEHTVLFAGHSLGGALALLAAADALTSGTAGLDSKRMRIFTVGQPRVGNSQFADFVYGLGVRTIQRVVNQNDLTPHLPPTFSGFCHVPNEIWVRDANGTTFECLDTNGHSLRLDQPESLRSLQTQMLRAPKKRLKGAAQDLVLQSDSPDDMLEDMPEDTLANLLADFTEQGMDGLESDLCSNGLKTGYAATEHLRVWGMKLGIKGCDVES
ncbi:Alpha/Beta hydrolase protein [Polychytrium aggregatum]|uniref:Alpha/Beta hydrolase protein n=1 Tax=Polychytrium aggregatum TaxID=110093 RepID=UPI0022FE0E8D|nr:Alpha/Beta hydrolase protein [Polychytrium aggregatum]KAI9202944.1 Alpha/Beta hydrolase protein [Polychytrium aggregatum]